MANKYMRQRKRVTPPHVSLRTLRRVSGMTLDEVCARVEELTDTPLTRGALSGIENGHRGASVEVLAGLAQAFDIDVEAFDTEYVPRSRVA